MLSFCKALSRAIGIIGLIIAAYGTIYSTTKGSVAAIWAYFGIPGILFLILSVYLGKKYKRDYPKTQEQIEAEQRAKAEKKEARQKKMAAAKEKREIQRKLEEERKAAEEREKQEKIAENLRKAEEIKNTVYYLGHVSGLPLSEGAICNIRRFDDEFLITGAGNNFHLPFQKVTDVCIKTDTELQKSYVSSIGGAIGGAVLFGTLGAMIGGCAKEKTVAQITYYLIITYIKDENVSYIGFEIKENLDKVLKWTASFISKHESVGKDIIL